MNKILLILSLLGFEQNTPARLGKNESKNKNDYFIEFLLNRIEAWVMAHASLCLFMILMALLIVFAALIFALTGVSAVESGVYHNHLADVI